MLGVASVALWAAGCARPKPAADPISRWELDETSSAEGVFEDRGPAHVLMVHAGLWADLTTGSLVEGDDGTSAYTNGSAYAAMPANVPAHDLAALTISFYYQRDSASDKHILLAAGEGSQPGDLSVEVLANGRLRAWHVGQDGVLRFFESTDGVAGTDLQVGTAYRIDLSLGSQGARIYLDGVELPAGAIPANTNGWNNARVKYLGSWTDGVQGPAVGVFDRLRIWNRQLSGAEIAELQAAQSITLPGEEPGQPGDALSVPSLAEWLPSDEADPAPTKYVSNQNRGNGSGSSPGNAQEVQAALDDASPGDVLLAVCQTPGTIEFWDYPSGLSFPAGLPGNPVTLQARNGDGVVISAGEAYGGARTPNSGFWTQSGLSQADIEKKIWRSTSTFPGGEQDMIGTWVEFDHVHQIIGPQSMANLRAAYGAADSFTNYAGPCAHQDSDGRLYIRFQRPHPGKYSVGGKWTKSLWPNNPEAVNASGELAYPVSEDPNDYVINIARQNPGSLYAFGTTGDGHVKIGSGINSCGFRRFAEIGSSNLTIRRGTHICWQVVVVSTQSNEVINWDVQRARFSDGSKRHLSRAEWKFGGPLEGIRSGFSLTGAWSRDLYFLNCTIADFHEIAVTGGSPNGNGYVRLRNCAIFNILDDGFQTRPDYTRVEIGYCFLLNSAYGGNGGGNDSGDPNPGEWFIHHNIIDQRTQKCAAWARNPHGPFLYLPHSAPRTQPRKYYNNTILYPPDTEGTGSVGLSHNHNIDNDAAAAHEVFNNIVIRHDVQRYEPTSPSPSTIYRDCAIERISCDPDFCNEYWDYNLYYRDVPEIPGGGFQHALMDNVRERKVDGGFGVNQRSFNSLAAFYASDLFALSKTSGTQRGAYSPGFESSGTDVKPTLPSLDDFPTSRFLYRPTATSEVTIATTSSLSGEDWWTTPPTWGDDFFSWSAGGGSLAPHNWKGALDPNGSTLTVGVLNS